MGAEKIPALERLLSPSEFRHVAAFPSVLRLLVHGPLLNALEGADPASLARDLAGLRATRLLDGVEFQLTTEELWEQLNFQLIHAIDFLPPGGWQRTCNEYFFAIFVRLHCLLSRHGQLRARVAWDPGWMRPAIAGTRPDTWRHWLIDMVPCKAISKMASSQIAKYSDAIGHSLEYELLLRGGRLQSKL